MKNVKIKYQTKTNVKLQDSIVLMILFALFIVLTITVNIGTSGYKEKQINLIHNSMEILGNNQKAQFQQFIDNKVVVLQGLSQYPAIYEMNLEEQKKFIKGNSQKFGFCHIFVVDRQGNGFYFDEDQYRDQSNEPFFYDVMNNDIFVSEPFFGENKIITTVSVSIYQDGIKQGVLCGAVELDEIAAMFAENVIPMQGKLLLLNRQGQYLIADDVNKVNSQKTIYEETNSDVSLIKEAFFDKSDKMGSMIFDGAECTTHITYLPNYDWVIVQSIDNKEIYKEINFFDLWRNGSVIIIVLIILCVIKIVLYWYQSVKKINTDSLTKCNSRVAMQNIIESLEHVYKKNVVIVYFDLNKFKQVNDIYGHDEGDRILCVFSAILMSTFYRYAQVGRMGGDEFLAIAVGISEGKVIELCNEVNSRLQEKKKELNLPYEISTSFGYAIRESGSKLLLSDIMKLADENMYHYKEEIHKQIKM